MFRRIHHYFSRLRWPQQETGPACPGVTWLELAIDFELFFQKELPYRHKQHSDLVYPEDTLGDRSPLNLSQRSRKMAGAARCFQRLTGARIFPCEEAKSSALRPLGVTHPLPGLQRRPLLLAQDNLEAVLRDVFVQSCWPSSGSDVSRCPPLRLVPHYSFSGLSAGEGPGLFRVEQPRRCLDAPRAVDGPTAIGS